jgi:hypothetical protein
VYRYAYEYCTCLYYMNNHEYMYCPSEFTVLSRTYSKIAVMGKKRDFSDQILVIQF